MVRCAVLCLLFVSFLISSVPVPVCAQTQLDLAAGIKLPAPSSPGKFGEWGAKRLFSIKVAPDQSLLVLDPDADGQWLLIRVRNWWSKEQASDVLKIPAWGAADSRNGSVDTDLQITPDGHYAIAFAAAFWSAPVFAKKGYTPRKPDTLITVVDLQQWQVVGNIHTANLDDANFEGARVLSNDWMVLQGWDEEPSTHEHEHLYDRRNQLISIPDLKPGPQCLSTRKVPLLPVQTPAEEWRTVLDTVHKQNDESCTEVLKVAGIASVDALESIIYKGHGVEPDSLLLHSLDFTEQDKLNSPRLPMDVVEEEQSVYYDHWNRDRFNTYLVAPPVESVAHRWYGAYGLYNKVHYYELEAFDADGRKVKEVAPEHLLCGKNAERGFDRNCACRVDDVSEEQHTLLTDCRVFSHDFAGAEISHEHWVSVFRSDDLSEVGSAQLSNDNETGETIAVAQGRAYVLAVEFGEALRVFAVPRRTKP